MTIKDILRKTNEGQFEKFSSVDLFGAFKQGVVDLPLLRRIGGGGNCASIALIKASIATFGFKRIFKSIDVDEAARCFKINLNDEDDALYSLSFDDYEYGAKKSAFRLMKNDEASKAIYEYAKFLFAVMAEVKRQSYRRRNNYARAVTDLNKGESTEGIYEWLGLAIDEVENASIPNLSSRSNLVLYNAVHAVYSDQGIYDEFFDGFGSTEPLKKLQAIHGDGSEDYAPAGAYSLK